MRIGTYRTDPPQNDDILPRKASRSRAARTICHRRSFARGGASQIIDFPRRMKRISIADSAIADIQVTNPFQLNLVGHKPGLHDALGMGRSRPV